MDEKFKVLYGLHRIVSTTTSVTSRLTKVYTDGKPEITLTINELGIKNRDHVYRIFGPDAQKQYDEAVQHLTEILSLNYTA